MTKKAIFISGYDGIDGVLSVLDNIFEKDAKLDLYTYNPASVPKFLLYLFENITAIPQTFYSRDYLNRSQKVIDRINFFKLYLKFVFKLEKGKKYDELHFLGFINNPSFLIYEQLLGKKNCATFHYRIPDRDYYRENRPNRDFKLWVLKKLFGRKFSYYDYPPQKTAIGLSEKEIIRADIYSWEILARKFKIPASGLNINPHNKNKILFLGTSFSQSLAPVNLGSTAQYAVEAIIKEFPNQTIYYKPHYRADFDLVIPEMIVVEQYIPAEFLIPYFDVVCGFDSTTFKSCSSGTRMVSVLKLIKYNKGDTSLDEKAFANTIGKDKFELVEFLTQKPSG